MFGRLGYRRTRMADVATQAGLSSGAVYTYVESKEALFHLVFAHAFGQFAEGMPAPPLATPAFAETLDTDRPGAAQGGRHTPAAEPPSIRPTPATSGPNSRPSSRSATP